MKNTIIVVLFIACIVLGWLYLSESKLNGVQSTIHEEAVNVLRSEIETLRTHENKLNKFIEGAKLTVNDKDQQLSDLKDRYEWIKNQPAKEVVIVDTVEYIENCEISKALLRNALEQIDVLESKSLILEDIVNDQTELISNLRTQNKNLEEIIGHKDTIIEIELSKNRKFKRQRNLAFIAGGVAVVLGILK